MWFHHVGQDGLEFLDASDPRPQSLKVLVYRCGHITPHLYCLLFCVPLIRIYKERFLLYLGSIQIIQENLLILKSLT